MNRAPSKSQAPRDIELEKAILLASGLFDDAWYVEQRQETICCDPISHYVSTGWLSGFEPNDSFPGSLLGSCFESLGFEEPPAVTWSVLHSAGWHVPSTRRELEAQASRVRASKLFDETFYLAQARQVNGRVDPAIHYVVVGERLGLAPSPGFDPNYYLRRYPDVAQAKLNCLLHYIHNGRAEYRNPVALNEYRPGKAIVDPKKENILLVLHEASRTGAPILGWNIALHLKDRYNIYTVRLGDGELIRDVEELSAAVYGPFFDPNRHESEIDLSLAELLSANRFRYAIVNSADSRMIIWACLRRFIPTLLLMHEFASYVSPIATLGPALDWSTEVVFPARIVARAAEDAHPALSSRTTHILPQGVAILPKSERATPKPPCAILEQLTREHDLDRTFFVLGAGAVQMRKGVDLFLATAAAVARKRSKRCIKFIWVGHGFRPKLDMTYSVYLQEQLYRSQLSSCVAFLDEVSDLGPLYKIADVFLLSSRLDPLPNVSIDAAIRGIPIVCFRNASGTSELLLSDPATAKGVVDHLDVDAAARVILEVAEDEPSRMRMAKATQRFARQTFDMRAYAAKLDVLGSAAQARMARRAEDARTLRADSTFDQDMFLGPAPIAETRGESIARYLTVAGSRGWQNDGPLNHVRRPCPGFHPRIYANLNARTLHPASDPLADYVRNGKPPGPWQELVLRPTDSEASIRQSGTLRVALHAHFFYPELAVDCLKRLRSNRTACDLLISTDQSGKARLLQRTFAEYAGGAVEIRVVQNKGRDIGPLLTEFKSDLARYDVIGHIHSKRSLLIGDGDLGNAWREFIWQHLLGNRYPMMDRIVAAFESDPALGLVFPSDPHLNGWDDNRDQAAKLATRMGWNAPLPDAFDFPLGTMFWARCDALAPLLNLGFTWDDYPDEPLPYDGTILHALERLLPLSAQLADFSFAVTHVPVVTW